MSKKYYTSSKSNKNNKNNNNKNVKPTNKYNNVVGKAKVRNADEVRKITQMFKTEIFKNGNLSHNLHNSAIKYRSIKEILKQYSIEKYQKATGYNYAASMAVGKKHLNPNGSFKKEYLTNVLNQLEDTTTVDGRLKTNMPIIFNNNDQRDKILNSPKKAVAFSLLSTYNLEFERNFLYMRTLYESEIDGEKYLYLMQETYKENAPDASFSLYLLPNGLIQGIKPLFRVDLLGHYHPEFLERHNIPHAFNEYLYPHLYHNRKHYNFHAKNETDEFIPNSTSATINHVHLTSPQQDYTMALCSYLLDNHVVYNRVDTSRLSAIDLETYLPSTMSKVAREIEDLKEARKTNGVISHANMFKDITKIFNLKDSIYTPELQHQIDEGRNSASSDSLPSSNYITHVAFEDIKAYNNADTIIYVRSKNKLIEPLNQFYRYTNRLDFLQYDFLKERAKTDPEINKIYIEKRDQAIKKMTSKKLSNNKDQVKTLESTSSTQKQKTRVGEKQKPEIKDKRQLRHEKRMQERELINHYYTKNKSLTTEELKDVDESELIK